ncbi:hypothetical protein QZH41_012375, partial [Actinostola sp. cb2023]
HVPYWWVNNPTLGEFCFAMIGRADIEGSKSNVAMNAWLPQASYSNQPAPDRIRQADNLSTRPVVVISGDPFQQQPIATVRNRITQTNNIYSDNSFHALCSKFTFHEQHRCADDEYREILNHLRYSSPTKRILTLLNSPPHLLYEHEHIFNTQIIQAITDHADSTVITVSKAGAAKVNSVIIDHFFNRDRALGTIQMDDDGPPTSIYKKMKVIITQNRNKEKGIVNGQPATIHLRCRNTIVLRLPNDKMVAVYPCSNYVQRTDGTGNTTTILKTVFPLIPGYAITICKAQGQTLSKCIAWMDSKLVAPGTGYVALSRVRTFDSIHFMTPLTKQHFKPVAYENT